LAQGNYTGIFFFFQSLKLNNTYNYSFGL